MFELTSVFEGIHDAGFEEASVLWSNSTVRFRPTIRLDRELNYEWKIARLMALLGKCGCTERNG